MGTFIAGAWGLPLSMCQRPKIFLAIISFCTSLTLQQAVYLFGQGKIQC